MAGLIAGGGPHGMFITRYTGPARDDGGPRARYQITRRDMTDLDGILTLSGDQLAELYGHLDRLARASSAGLAPPPQAGPCTHELPQAHELLAGYAVSTWLSESTGRHGPGMSAAVDHLLSVLESVADANRRPVPP